MNLKRLSTFKTMLKWSILSVIIGAAAGSITGLFVKIVIISSKFTNSFKYFYFLIPCAFLLSGFITNKLCPAAKGHGTEKAIESYHKLSGKMDIKVIPVKMITSLITVVSGGSVGLEGPGTQIGAGIASFISDMLKINEKDRKILAVCGISAGFTAVFNAPIGGAIYAVEVLYIGKISYNLIFPAIISALTSSMITKSMGLNQVSYNISYNKISVTMLLEMILFGIIIGISALLFIFLLDKIESYIHNLNMPFYLKPILGGILLIALIMITGNFSCLGTGSNYIANLVSGKQSTGYTTFLTKMLATSLTLGSGGSGGILTPMLFIGASLGNICAKIIGSNVAIYTAAGMTGFLGACSNTPIAATIIAFEIFGRVAGVYAAAACITAFIISGIKTVYKTQVVTI